MMICDVINSVFLKRRQLSGYGGSGLIACKAALRWFIGILFVLILTGLPFVMSAHAGPIQNSATGTANGLAMDLANASVTLNQSVGFAVTSVAAEIEPNSIVVGSVGNAFVYDIQPTINAVDTGVNVTAITAPAGYTNLSVTGVSVGGAGQTLNCALGAGEYCVNIVGQVMTITLGTKVTVSGTNIQVSFTADAPVAVGSADFTSTVDDNSTPAFAAQATAAGNADGDAADNNSISDACICSAGNSSRQCRR
jgi:hypothetical protein